MGYQAIYLQSIALAILQGLTEFLPISSSGHLVIVRAIFDWSDEGGLLYDTLLHAGSLAALLIYFWRDWLAILQGYAQPRVRSLSWQRRLPWLLLVATLPVALAGPLLKPWLESALVLRNPRMVGLSMLATAVFFWLSERRLAAGRAAPEAGALGFRQALIIGLLQVVALLPGASRSGWTTGAGMLCGQARPAAIRFAFWMALPAIAGAVILQSRELWAAPAAQMAPLPLLLGFLFSFLASLGAIHFCLKFFRSHTLRGFAIYLAIAGLLIVAL